MASLLLEIEGQWQSQILGSIVNIPLSSFIVSVIVFDDIVRLQLIGGVLVDSEILKGSCSHLCPHDMNNSTFCN